MSAATQNSKNRLSASIEAFKAKSGADKRRAIADMLFNNAMYIIILIAVIYIAIRVPEFISTSSIVNIVSLTAAKLPIALGIAGAIVLTGTDISAGRCVGLTACIAASLLQMSGYANKIFPNIGVTPLWMVLLAVIAVGAAIGFVNGFFVAKFKLHPFIVTLSTQLIVFGLVLMYLMIGGNNGQTLSGLDSSYTDLVRGTLFKVGSEVCSVLHYPNGNNVGYLEQNQVRQEYVCRWFKRRGCQCIGCKRILDNRYGICLSRCNVRYYRIY